MKRWRKWKRETYTPLTKEIMKRNLVKEIREFPQVLSSVQDKRSSQWRAVTKERKVIKPKIHFFFWRIILYALLILVWKGKGKRKVDHLSANHWFLNPKFSFKRFWWHLHVGSSAVRCYFLLCDVNFFFGIFSSYICTYPKKDSYYTSFLFIHILIEVHKGLTVKNTDPSSTSIKKRIRIRKNKNWKEKRWKRMIGKKMPI